MKNLILTTLACAVHIGIHQVTHHYSLISVESNRNLLFLALFATFAFGITADIKHHVHSKG